MVTRRQLRLPRKRPIKSYLTFLVLFNFYFVSFLSPFYKHKSNILNIAENGGNLDFSFADVIFIVSNPNATAISRSATFASTPSLGVTSSRSGKKYLNIITAGADFNVFKAYLLTHELGHTFGLPDLYSYDQMRRQNEFVGEWSIMGSLNEGATVKDYLGWEKWLLGWLLDSQIMCVKKIPKSNTLVNIVSLEISSSNNDIKLVVIKLSETHALAIESRRLTSNQNSGLLIYLIDTSVSTGNGGIRILEENGSSTTNNSNEDKMKSILTSPGQMLHFMDVTVKYLSKMLNMDVLEVVVA